MRARWLKFESDGSGEVPQIVGTTKVVPASALFCGPSYNYREPAYVPSGEWEALQELTEPADGGFESVALFALPNFELKFLRDGPGLPPDDQSLEQAVQAAAGRWLIPQLKSILAFGQGHRPVGLFRHAAGLPTTTVDRNGLRTGLHVDSWFGDSLDGRSRRPGRLVFNFGPGLRYFYAVGPRLSQRSSWGLKSSKEIAWAFLSGSSPKLVIRLTLPPGYGYIADTEDIIHDGSTLDSPQPSYTYTIMANFDFSQFECQQIFGFSLSER